MTEAIGVPNLIATALSLTVALAILTRPHVRGDWIPALGSVLILIAVFFCFANAIRAAIEIARSDRSGSEVFLLLRFLFDGILNRNPLTPAVRNARNGLWVGLLALTAGLVCLSLPSG